MRRALVAGNWKMNGNRAEASALVDGIVSGLDGLDAVDVAVCPPFILIPLVAERFGNGAAVTWGGQNMDIHESGAYTGEVSGHMLRDFGCTYVIVGHSERRTLYGEDDALVAEKFAAAQRAGLVPILCVGESLEERETGRTETVVGRQIDAVVSNSGADAVADAVIAYEPVWAIGTGRTATPEQAQDVHRFIRERIAAAGARADELRVLYGGSMKPDNAASLMAQPDVDGGLIGGASLKAADFLAICRAAAA
jgi:triosephosphate isomerase